ncbi:MAG: DUF4012 domain-containing protein [Candidatus Moranbacteria bacterium]|nr:DUF4012 domain-containing protein [Candidatus Moranbacteria bacterium]
MEKFEFPRDQEKNLAAEKTAERRRGWKFWLSFWTLAILFLAGWAVFWQVKNNGWFGLLGYTSPAVSLLPIAEKQKEEIRTIFDVVPKITQDNEEKTFLVLFQNNMELRPGGGYIGAFGILKTKGEKIVDVQVHDTNVFDSRKSTNIDPPYPMGEMLSISNWEMRDSNWSPDFPANAEKAIELYQKQGGEEKFDGVAAISTEVLLSFLEAVGPIKLENYPGEYNSENAVMKLEYQVEKGYREQNIEKGKRKYVMKELAREILARAQSLTWQEKKELLLAIENHLDQKDVMIYFKKNELQEKVNKLGWDGEVDENFDKDYLMMVDANLGALKTDLHMERSFDYTVDFSEKKPQATLDIHYENTAKARDWLTRDYRSYLRVYAPEGSWLTNTDEAGVVRFGEEFNKKYFGTIVNVPINSKKTVTFEYDLPESITREEYSLKIQKQSGIDNLPGKITIIDENLKGRIYEVEVVSDKVLFKK